MISVITKPGVATTKVPSTGPDQGLDRVGFEDVPVRFLWAESQARATKWALAWMAMGLL